MTMSAIVDTEILCSADGEVRYTSLESGTPKWKEGNLQVGVKGTGQCICILNFKVGRPRSFKLTNNVKGVTKVTSNPGRITLALKDGANISLNKGNFQEVQRLNKFLDDIKTAKSGRISQNGTRSFDLIKSPTTPKQNSNTPFQSSENKSIRKTIASRRSAAGLDDSDDGSSSDEETGGRGIPALFVEEQEDQLDKENRSVSMERQSVFRQRKQEGISMFLSSAQEKTDTYDGKKSRTPVSGLTNKNFYGSGSRGKDMVNISRLGGGASFSQRTLTSSIKRPGMLEPTPNYVKKARLLDTYDGWKPKSIGSQPSRHGFSNLGNTCYMNAILQSLFGLNSFTNDLLRQDVMRAVEKVSLYWAVTSLLKAKQQRRFADKIGDQLRLVKTAISATATRFSGFMQHDAHEFLCQCMDQLKEDVDKANKSSNGETKPALTNGETKPALTNGDTKPALTNGETKPALTNGEAKPGMNGDHTTDKQQPSLSCPVTSNFEFEVLHAIRCKDCGEVVTKTEEFYDLSVDMPRTSTKSELSANIQTALDQFFRQEEIEYTCSECGGKLATVTHKFTKLPRILILHLKRYTFDVEASRNAKLRQPIGIPKYLTLHWHCTSETSPSKEVTCTNGSTCMSTAPGNSEPNEGQRVTDDNQGNPRKRLNFQFSPRLDAKPPFLFNRKRFRKDSDSELERDPFRSEDDDATQQAIRESKSEEEKRKQDDFKEEDLMKKALEDSKNDASGVTEITSMTEEEQIEYALALSRGEEWHRPAPDANANHTFTQSTQNGHVSWSNGIVGGENGVGVDEPDVNHASETKLAEYGEQDQRLPLESGKTGEIHTSENGQQTSASSSYHPHDSVNGIVQSGDDQWETIPSGDGQWDSNATSPNGGDFSVHKETNRDSGFVSPELNGHLNGTEVSFNKDSETSKNDSAIESDKECQTPPNIPPKQSKITDFSNVIDLCGDEGKDAATGGTDAAGNGLSYAELKAKDEEDLRRAMELSLQDVQHLEETEEEQLRRVQEMSLQEFNQSFEETVPPQTSPQEDTANQEPMYTKEMVELLKGNVENGEMPHSYRLISVVNHIGSSSSAGHYVSDVYDTKKDSWFSYDDSNVQKVSETTVRENRCKSGYIFFYAVNYH